MSAGAPLVDFRSHLHVGKAVALIQSGDCIYVGFLQSLTIDAVPHQQGGRLDADALLQQPCTEITISLDIDRLNAIAGPEAYVVSDVRTPSFASVVWVTLALLYCWRW